MDRIAVAYARRVVQLRWWVLLASAALFAVTTAGVFRGIEISDNYRIFFDAENPQLKALDEFEGTYIREEGILFVVGVDEGTLFTPKYLAVIEDLTERSWQIEYVQRVDSITNFQHTYAEADDLVVEDLIYGAAEFSEADVARVRDIALEEPLLVGRSLSPDGRVTTVHAIMELPGEQGGERAEPMHQAREMAAEIRAEYPELTIHLNGGAVLSHAFSEHTAEDSATLVPLMYLVILVLIPIALRSWVSSLAVAATIVMSVGTAIGMVGWTGLSFAATSAAMPHIVMTLAVADCVHVLVVLVARMRAGDAKVDAIVESLRVSFGPVLLTSVTTAIGLLSLNFSPVPPMRDFGNMVTMGVVAAFVYSVFFLPALIAVLPLRVAAKTETAAPSRRLADFVLRYRTPLFGLAVLTTVVLGALIPRNEFKNNWTKWFGESTELSQATVYMREHLSGSNTFEFSIGADGSGGIADPEYLRHLDTFSEYLTEQPGIDKVVSIVDILKRLNMNMHGDDPAHYAIPESRALAAQYLLLYEMSLPYGLDLNTQINIDKSASRMTVITDNVDSTTLNAMRKAHEVWLREHAPDYMHAEATSNSVMFASIAENAIRGMVVGVPAALLVVSIVLVFAFRSLKFGLISLIPNLMPLVMAYGVWGLLVGRINFGLAAVAGLSIGIVVDDTVHFLSKYIRGRREHGYGPEDAIRYAFDSVGRAMIITSVVLVAGFAVLSVSVFRFNANMGMLAAITIAIALVADLLFLPPILLMLDRERKTAATEGNQET